GRGEGMRDRRGKARDEDWPEDRGGRVLPPEGPDLNHRQGRPRAGGPAGGPGGGRGRPPGPPPPPPERPDRGSAPGGSREPAADEWPATQPVPLPGSEAGITESGLAGAGGLAGAAALAGAAGLAGSPAGAATRPYGRILIFTLLEDRVTDFD